MQSGIRIQVLLYKRQDKAGKQGFLDSEGYCKEYVRKGSWKQDAVLRNRTVTFWVLELGLQ